MDEEWSLVDAIVAFWRRDKPVFPNYAAGTWGPLASDELHPARRALLAALLSVTETRRTSTSGTAMTSRWTRCRSGSASCGLSAANGHSDLRTSVMTHTAWVPKNWLDAARGALAGLAEAHPSRTILLVPDPDAERNAIDAQRLGLSASPRARHASVCSEVVELHLCGCAGGVSGQHRSSRC